MVNCDSFILGFVRGRLLLPFLLLLLFSVPSFAAVQPTINLFPQDVRSLLSETHDVSQQMETELKGIIAGFQQQTELYKSANCEGSSDAGCKQIKDQIFDRYKSMLEVMETHLPAMSRNIEATAKSMGKTLRGKVGKKMSPFALQDLLNSKKQPSVIQGRFSLSQRLARYHQLIAANGSQTVADLAAEIYLDSTEAAKWMDIIFADIQRQKVFIDQQDFLFALSDEAMGTVESVKSLLFGEDVTTPDMPGQQAGDSPSGIQGFVPELEM